MKQTERVLRHMREVGSITAAEAMSEYGIFRLAARISDLREQGHTISRRMVAGKNRYGEAVSFAEYRLEEDNNHVS